jgi:predicted nucleic acid-binding protein
MRSSTKRFLIVPERLTRGLLDTSVIVDLDRLDVAQLPEVVAISTVTLAELSCGPSATTDRSERARRQDRLQRAEATFDPLPFDIEAARAYGRVCAAALGQGRQSRRRFADLLIAATALAEELPLVTRNSKDFDGLEDLITVVEV